MSAPSTCPLKVALKVAYQGRTLEIMAPCELAHGHLGKCDAPKLQAAAGEPKGVPA